MIRLFLVTAVALASLVASPAAREPQSAPPAPPAEAAAPSQTDVEAQLARMLEELRRENARRGAATESVVAPAPKPAAAPSKIPPPRARAVPTLPSKPLVIIRLSAARLSPPPPRPVAPKPSPPPPRLEPPAPAPPPRASSPDTAAAARPVPPVAAPEAPVEAPPASAERADSPVVSGGLPDVGGFTSEEVRAFLGAPHTIQQGATGVTAWFYTTPAGRLPVYFVKDLATVTLPAAKRGAPLPIPTRRVPAHEGACDGVLAVTGPKLLVVAPAETPAFIEPRFRQVPLAMLVHGARLEVVRPEGAWYLVRFNDERWGKRNGYVHCRDVAVP